MTHFIVALLRLFRGCGFLFAESRLRLWLYCGFQRPCRRGGQDFKATLGCGFSSVVGAGGGCCRYRILSCVLCSGLGCNALAAIAHK